jgi:hypothetical protein
MNKSPNLIKISETAYGCSECEDFKLELVGPGKKTAAQIENWIGQEFLSHLKRRHSKTELKAKGPRKFIHTSG